MYGRLVCCYTCCCSCGNSRIVTLCHTLCSLCHSLHSLCCPCGDGLWPPVAVLVIAAWGAHVYPCSHMFPPDILAFLWLRWFEVWISGWTGKRMWRRVWVSNLITLQWQYTRYEARHARDTAGSRFFYMILRSCRISYQDLRMFTTSLFTSQCWAGQRGNLRQEKLFWDFSALLHNFCHLLTTIGNITVVTSAVTGGFPHLEYLAHQHRCRVPRHNVAAGAALSLQSRQLRKTCKTHSDYITD